MPRKRWIKLWTQETLYGTTSQELELDEQAIWFKLLALAGDSPEPGKVEIAPGIPITDQQIARIMNAPLAVWLKTKQRLLDPDVDKIHINEGIIYVTNWEKYQGEFDRAEYMKDYMRNYRKSKRKTNSKTANSKTVEQNRGEGRGREQNATTASENLANNSKLYEENIGMLTPAIAESLKDIAEKYPPGWFQEALKEAVKSEHRNLKYIEAILERWQTEGFKAPKQKGAKGVKRGYETHQRGDKESSAERLRQSLE